MECCCKTIIFNQDQNGNLHELKNELENLVKDHYKITKDLNSLDTDNSIL